MWVLGLSDPGELPHMGYTCIDMCCPTEYGFSGKYISLTPGPWTIPTDLVHGLLEWTTDGLPWMDHPEICGKHEFNDAGTRTKAAFIDKHNYRTQLIQEI